MNVAWDLLSRWQWALLLTIPPLIVLLYFLKLRREPLEVPSTYLWSRTIEDMHVNSIWQRLRRNLLLFLQLLLLLLAILACLNPNWRGTTLEDDRAIFLIDNSASSMANDMGRSRLEEAKFRAKELINNELGSGDKGMIIAFSDGNGARTIQSYTDNKRTLIRKLDTIEPTHRRTSLKQALSFAAGLANPNRSSFGDSQDVNTASAKPASLFILSDGRVTETPNFSLGNLKPTYVMLGTADAKNVGITAFQATKNPDKPDQLQVFAGIRNYSNVDQRVSVELFRDDNMIDASEINLIANAEGGREFSLAQIDSGTLRLEIEANDDFDVDDRAYAILDTTQRTKVLIVTRGNVFLTSAFTTERITKYADVKITTPDFLEGEEYLKDSAEGTYDLVIFDECAPVKKSLMPLSNTLFFGALPPSTEGAAELPAAETNFTNSETEWTPTEKVAGPAVIDTDKLHPIMQFANVGNILIGESYTLEPPKGATTLIDTDLGPVAAIATRDSVQDLVIGFALIGRDDDGGEYYNTTWVRNDPSYPVFIQNVLNYLGGISESEDVTIYRPGQLIQLRLDTPSKELQLTAPDGKTSTVGRGRTGAFSFATADKVGIYQLTDEAVPDVKHRVAVNLFDETESNIIPVKELAFDENVKIASGDALQRTRRETWKWLVMLVLVVLLAEWYIYNRRVYL